MTAEGLRAAVLDTAMEIGREAGEDGVTMRAIAARLGISATALYQHFDSKAAILHEIRLLGSDMLVAAMEGGSDCHDALERLAALSLHYVQFSRDEPWLYRLMFEFDLMDWPNMSEPDAQRVLAPLAVARRALLRAAESGRVPADLDIENAMLQMWSALHGLCNMVMNGRISEEHPALAIPDLGRFVDGYVEAMIVGFGRGSTGGDRPHASAREQVVEREHPLTGCGDHDAERPQPPRERGGEGG